MTESPHGNEPRQQTLRTSVFVLAVWNMASFLLYATADWSAGEPWTLYMRLQFMMLVIVQPLVSLAALYFAWKNERITLALWLVAVPWIFYLLNFLAFAAGVAIHGF